MLTIPIESAQHQHDMLIIVLGDANIERLKVSDPAEVPGDSLGAHLVNPTVLVCHQNHTPEFQKVLASKDIRKIIAYLQRGFKFQPEKGDHDRGPEPLADQN